MLRNHFFETRVDFQSAICFVCAWGAYYIVPLTSVVHAVICEKAPWAAPPPPPLPAREIAARFRERRAQVCFRSLAVRAARQGVAELAVADPTAELAADGASSLNYSLVIRNESLY